MNKSDNCQNCDAKDKVTIAGKTFCSNCGTPDPVGVSQDAQSSQSTPQTPAAPLPTQNQNTVSSASVAPNAVDTAPNDLADSITQSLLSSDGTLSSETKPTQPSVDIATPIADSHNINTVSENLTPNPAPSTVVANTAQLPNAPIYQASNIQKFNAPVGGGMHTIQPESASANGAAATDLQDSAATPTAAYTSAPPAVDSIKTGTQDETLGSEISTLDSSDDHVFSDDQFSALAKAGNDRPIDVAKLSQKPVSRGVRPMTDITPSTPTQPGQIVTPTNSAPSSSLDTAANVSKPIAIQPNQPLKPTPAPAVSSVPAVQPSPAVSTVVDQAQLQTTQLKEHKIAKKGAKIGSVAFTAVGILLLGAYVWQVNYPNLALKVASSKAGISASIPSYLPSGWQVSSNINSSPGSISYELISADGKATATINEKKTDWDSQALAENYVNNQSDKYLALQAEGLTIYVYNNQASWVNNGTWYRVEGANTGLSQDQLIRMATSL